MNLYGDYGNVVILKKRLEELGMDVEVDERSESDVLFDGSTYDFIYCGAGTEKKRDKALGLLSAEKDALRDAIEAEVHVLFTGNSWEMLGKSIRTVDGEDAAGLGLFDYVTTEVDTRVTHDIVAETELLDRPVVGFVNKCGSVTDVPAPDMEDARREMERAWGYADVRASTVFAGVCPACQKKSRVAR